MKLFSKNRLGRNSIKESLDDLPSGICFANQKGIIVLCNRKMDMLSRELIGHDLQYLTELEEALERPQQTVTIADAKYRLYQFGRQVWRFSKNMIRDKYGAGYTEILAIDVTELYEKEAELKRENEILEITNARAIALYGELDRIVRDEENFAMKVKIHDELGMALLKSRQLLSGNPTLEELKRMGVLWSHIGTGLGITDTELAREAAFCAEKERMELVKLMEGIGVHMEIIGNFPAGELQVRLLSSAIRECATNLVRHAEGNEMLVELFKQNGKVYADITNNGKCPEREIKEGGGLSALRKRIETAGGSMMIQSIPRFQLRIILPEEDGL